MRTQELKFVQRELLVVTFIANGQNHGKARSSGGSMTLPTTERVSIY